MADPLLEYKVNGNEKNALANAAGGTPTQGNPLVTVAGLNAGVEAETNRADAVETQIQANLTAEVNRAQGAEGVLANLGTLVKTSLVAAINEVFSRVAGVTNADGTLKAGIVTAGKIADGAISAASLFADAVISGSKIASNTITAENIANGAVGSSELADGAVATSAKIGTGVVSGTNIAANTISADNIGSGAVGSSELADGAVTAGKLADGAITAAKLGNAQVTESKLADGSVTSSKLGALALPASVLQAQALAPANLVLDPTGAVVDLDQAVNGRSRWLNPERMTLVAGDAANPYVGGRTLRLSLGNGQTAGWKLWQDEGDVPVGDTIQVALLLKAVVGETFRLRTAFYTAAGSLIGGTITTSGNLASTGVNQRVGATSAAVPATAGYLLVYVEAVGAVLVDIYHRAATLGDYLGTDVGPSVNQALLDERIASEVSRATAREDLIIDSISDLQAGGVDLTEVVDARDGEPTLNSRLAADRAAAQNASNLGSGTVPYARMPAPVTDSVTQTTQMAGDFATATARVEQMHHLARIGTGLDDKGFWDPGAQPAGDGSVGSFVNIADWRLTEWINAWEALRLGNTDPTYSITRESKGKDATNTYDIWRYIFEPPLAEKTILVTGGKHATEMKGAACFLRLMQYATNEWHTHPLLAYLRWRVRVVVFPTLNAWGLSQVSRQRKNGNGVDLNRNPETFWANGDSNAASGTYRGPSAWSEAEAVTERDTMLEFASTLVAYLDLHDFGVALATDPEKFVAFLPDGSLTSNRDVVRDVIEWMRTSASDRITFSQSSPPQPYAHNYAASLGINAATLEFAEGAWSNASNDSASMTAGVKWYGNVILKMALLDHPTKAYKPKSRARYYSQSPSNLQTIPSGSNYEAAGNTAGQGMPPFYDEFAVPGPGYVRLSGSVVVGGPAGNVFLKVLLAQGGTSGVWSNLSGAHVHWEQFTALTATSERRTISLNALLPVLGHRTGTAPNTVQLGLYGYSTGGAATIYRYNLEMEFVPCDDPDRATILRVTNDGTGTIRPVQQYPTV